MKKAKLILQMLSLCIIMAATCFGYSQSAQFSEATQQYSDGSWRHHVVNVGKNNMVAALVKIQCGKNSLYQFFDPLLVGYGVKKPLEPNEFFDVPLSSKSKDCPGGVTAALYSDGSLDGSSDDAKLIYVRRKAAYTELVWIEKDMDEINASGLGLDRLLQSIKDRISVVNANRQSTAEWAGQTAVLTFISLVLQEHSVPAAINSVANPLVTISEAEQKQKMSPNQAYVFVFDQHLKQWLSDLKNGGIELSQ